MNILKQFEKIRLKSNEAALLSLIIVVFLVLFTIMWDRSGTMASLTVSRNQVAASKAKLDENKALYDKLTKRSPSSEGLNTDYLDQYLKLNDHFSSVITGIVNSSKGNSFALNKISLESQAVENGYKQMLYSLDAEASFIAIGKFLERLEDAPLLTEVSSIEISRIDNEMKRCQAHIKLFSYVRAE